MDKVEVVVDVGVDQSVQKEQDIVDVGGAYLRRSNRLVGHPNTSTRNLEKIGDLDIEDNSTNKDENDETNDVMDDSDNVNDSPS